jgi:hypothetical protein
MVHRAAYKECKPTIKTSGQWFIKISNRHTCELFTISSILQWGTNNDYSGDVGKDEWKVYFMESPKRNNNEHCQSHVLHVLNFGECF